MRINYAIIFVSDMQRSLVFYRDVLELPLRFESPHWSEFATEGATLALHATNVVAAPSDDRSHERSGSCRPGFSVPDLDAFHQRMIAAHVVCVQPPKPVFGARVAQYLDPDGLVLSVGEERQGR